MSKIRIIDLLNKIVSKEDLFQMLADKYKEIERLKEEIDLCDTNKRVIKDLNKSLTEVHKEKERLKSSQMIMLKE